MSKMEQRNVFYWTDWKGLKGKDCQCRTYTDMGSKLIRLILFLDPWLLRSNDFFELRDLQGYLVSEGPSGWVLYMHIRFVVRKKKFGVEQIRRNFQLERWLTFVFLGPTKYDSIILLISVYTYSSLMCTEEHNLFPNPFYRPFRPITPLD